MEKVPKRNNGIKKSKVDPNVRKRVFRGEMDRKSHSTTVI